MKGQTDEPIYAEANNNFLKEVSSLRTTLVSGLGTTFKKFTKRQIYLTLTLSFLVISIGQGSRKNILPHFKDLQLTMPSILYQTAAYCNVARCYSCND